MKNWTTTTLLTSLLAAAGCAETPPAEDPSASTASETETESQDEASAPGDDTLASATDIAEAPVEPVEQEPVGPYLEVPVVSRSGSSLTGTVVLEEGPKSAKVTLDVKDAEPGLHGVHIHQTADCSALDAKSAGGHFNPLEDPHGIPGKMDEYHLGDLGNLEVGADGTGHLEKEVPFADLSEDSDASGFSFHGRALIVHADPDTGAQPTGNSGLRVGCAELTDEAAKAHSDEVDLTAKRED